MKKFCKKGLSVILAVIMVVGLIPATAYAAVDSTGKPDSLNYDLVLSLYVGEGFPGEPAVYGTGDYKNFNSSFKVSSGAVFAKASSRGETGGAVGILNKEAVFRDLVQGTPSSNTKVWGVYDTNGLRAHFDESSSIIDPKNEAAMIRAVMTNLQNASDEAVLDQYEIVWYVIKFQHSPGSGWFSRSTSEWHIDGVIKEREKISINYYGNGNTSGSAPLGTASHVSGASYTVLDKNTMVKKINGVEVAFLGWSAKADGTGEEHGFYQPGDVINPTESISLYAMWDTTTQYTATVNTYLDGKLMSDKTIHGEDRNLYLSTDNIHFYALTEGTAGVYTAKITGNGKFHLYNKEADGTYAQYGNFQLTIYNQNATLDIHHYSVNYNTNGGAFENGASVKEIHYYGDSVNVINDVPVKDGYRFLGWEYSGKTYNAGDEVTNSISKAITLTAKWEKTVNVTVNVTINHYVEGTDGYDRVDSKDEVHIELVSRPNSNSDYLETGDTLDLSKASTIESTKVTEYIGNVFTDMPGGTTEYTVVASKSGYETEISAKQDNEGNWIIDVVMTYKPSNFDIEFTVNVDKSVPDAFVPSAAIVKVTFWAADRGRWETITQQAGDLPGVRVNIDPATRTGSGSYPVWKYESNGETPYGYRIEVTAFVYPDGTIVHATDVQDKLEVAWTDEVYTATMQEVTGGAIFGTLYGAYYNSKTVNGQKGVLNAVITIDLADVTFDANGGKVNGYDKQIVEDQYKIPAFKDYVPTRDGGYLFGGWYLDKECTKPATEGADLKGDITLYADWIEPLTIGGTVNIKGTYTQNGSTIHVNDIDRAEKEVIVLEEFRDGKYYEVDSIEVTFTYDANGEGSATYKFSGIPNDGKSYRVHTLVLNYSSKYDNEKDADKIYTDNEYDAVFAGDHWAQVDVLMEFVPPAYDQQLVVDATKINDGFRPQEVLSEVLYRDAGDNHPYNRITQHNVAPYGVIIPIVNGAGNGKQSVWKWHTDGTLYDYQMNITKYVPYDDNTEKAYNSAEAPFYIIYDEAAYWDTAKDNYSSELKATLIPKQYKVEFNLNAGADLVTGMDSFKKEDGTYYYAHTWSFESALNAIPQRAGYTFVGWDVTATNDNDKKISTKEGYNVVIDPSLDENVVLTAIWNPIVLKVDTSASPAEGGTTTGAGNYNYGLEATVTATPNDNYTFEGWYENDVLVSASETYTFTVLTARNLVAKFVNKSYKVTTTADPENGGTVTGAGTYNAGDTAIVTATPNMYYTFVEWRENGEVVSTALSYSFTVSANRDLVAIFKLNTYKVEAFVKPDGSGTVTGMGEYQAGETATLEAIANEGYTFAGWYDGDNCICTGTKFSIKVDHNYTFEARFISAAYKNDYAYIFGYTDTVMGAEGPLLRSEISAMVHRLARQNNQRGEFVYDASKTSFTDIAGEWFQSAIEYIHYRGGFDATPGSAVNANAQVTRGEVFKIVSLGLNFTTDKTLSYEEYGAILVQRGYIVGTSGGNLDTGSVMSRAQFCVMFNRIIGRFDAKLVDANNNPITAETYGFTDLDPTAWYYEDVLRATSAYDENGYVDISKRGIRNYLDDYS